VALRTPYLLFIGDAPDQLAAKTADGIAFWRPEICLGQLRLPGCKADLRLPDMTIEEAAAAGVKTVIVGTTNRGGVLGEGWDALLVRALELGMDLAAGLHHRLADIPMLRDAASPSISLASPTNTIARSAPRAAITASAKPAVESPRISQPFA